MGPCCSIESTKSKGVATSHHGSMGPLKNMTCILFTQGHCDPGFGSESDAQGIHKEQVTSGEPNLLSYFHIFSTYLEPE